jgi:two-component system, chemotaxis family, chemotaxis protein CheY
MSLRVLVVDDSKAMRALIRRALVEGSQNEICVDEAEDGLSALAQIRDNPPDLVLTNWNMPEMSGIELLETLQRDGAEVAFGFITSEGSEQNRERALSAGARFIIRKPFTRASLQHAVQQAASPSK